MVEYQGGEEWAGVARERENERQREARERTGYDSFDRDDSRGKGLYACVELCNFGGRRRMGIP